MKKIIILGASLFYKKTIEKVKEAGFYVIALDRNPNAVGKFEANEFFAIDIIDEESVLKIAKNLEVDGIMAINEFGSRSASYVASVMGLNGHLPEVVERTNDKGLMRDAWSKNSVLNQPRYFCSQNAKELENALKIIGFPCVMKPADSGGSGRGISVLKSDSDFRWALNFAKPFARNSRIIIEEFIEGVELTIESFTIDGTHYILAISDKVKPELKTRVATSLNYPASLTFVEKDKVKNLVSKALTSLGILNGIAHTEVILTQNDAYLVETGARGGGGHIFHTIIEEVSGINAPMLQAKWLTNDEVGIEKIYERSCCYRFFNPPKGILRSVDNLSLAAELPGVIDLEITKKTGEEVGRLVNSLEREGYVVTRGKNREEAISVADKVEALIKFNVDELR